jgi:hypothetical protein
MKNVIRKERTRINKENGRDKETDQDIGRKKI